MCVLACEESTHPHTVCVGGPLFRDVSSVFLPPLAAELQAAVATVSPAALRHRARLCLTAESNRLWADRSLFSPRSVPLLYLAGAADVVVANTDHAAGMRAARRDVPWVRVAGAPHLALQAAPNATAAVVERFLATCAAGLALRPA